MGSAGETLKDYVDFANSNGAKLAVVQVRVYRPFVASAFQTAFQIQQKEYACWTAQKKAEASMNLSLLM